MFGKYSRLYLMMLMGFAASASELSAQPAGGSEERVSKDLAERGTARIIVEMRQSVSGVAVSASSYLGGILSGTDARVGGIDQRTAVIRADRSAWERLKSDRMVASAVRDEPIPTALGTSVQLMGGKDVWALGKDGKGVAIAVLDTGVDANHPFLSGKVIMQACFSVSDQAAASTSLCPGGAMLPDGASIDFSPGAAMGCPQTIAGCKHGTHVAGIVAGKEMQVEGATLAGVAKGADVVAVQVFSRIDNQEDCKPNPAPCVLSYTSSQLRALQFIHGKVLGRVAGGEGPRIVAVNMSLGGGHNGVACDTGANLPYARRIKSLRDDGVATFIAAGNDGFPDGVSFPGCISGAITIGAIHKPATPTEKLRLADFSNRFEDKLVDLVTFGVGIKSAVPGGQFLALDGTSMATPHAAGAYAVLAEAFPNASVDEIERVMKQTGTEVREPFSGKKLPAIRLPEAYARLKGGTPAVVATGPATKSPSAATSGRAMESTSGEAQQGTRFLITTPRGRAHEASASIQRSTDTVARALNVSGVTVSPIGDDLLSLSTSGQVSQIAVKEALKSVVSDAVEVTVDSKVPPAR